jgi:multidrug resistance efflux pump
MASAFHKTDQSLHADHALVSGLLLLAGLMLIAAWVTWAFSAHVTRYEVSDSARLEVAGAASPVEASETGEVAMSHLVLGQPVQAGSVLVQLDDRDQRLALHQEQTRRNQLGPQLEALGMQIQSEEAGLADEERVLAYSKSGAQAQVEQAKAEAVLATQEADRARKLRSAGLISEAEAQKARASAESKSAALANLKQSVLILAPELQVKASDRMVKQREILTDIAKLHGEMADSNAEISRLVYEIEKRKLRAAVSGKLTECLVLHPGAHINEGQKLGVILPAGKVHIVADFNPASAFGKLHAGQRATIRLDGFPWAQFGVLHATVSRVAGEIHDGKVHVELSVNPTPGSRIPLQHGLPGTVEVSVEQVTPVAILLRSAGRAIGAH